MSRSEAPTQQRYMRACMVCSVVQAQQRFRDYGCPNCEIYLNLAGNNDAIEAFTSQVFEGLITLASPERSWVAKWQRLSTYKPGLYAIKVSGQLSDEARLQWEENSGMEYIPRDGSATDAD